MEASSDIPLRNVELARRGFEAYNAGDYEGVVELLHSDVKLHADHELLNSGDYEGREGFMQWSAQWLEAWEDFRVNADSIATFGDNWVLVDSHQVARGAGSGIPVEMDVFWALEAVDGKLSRMYLFASRDRALHAIESWRADRDGDA